MDAIDQTLSGQRVLITGAGQGIGAATARTIIERGGCVAIYDVDAEAAERTAACFDADQAISLSGDVCDDGTVGAALDAMFEHWGGIDALVNNAGIYDHAPLLELSRERWQRVMDVNLMAPILISNAVVKRMTDGGAIVNVSSVLGQVAAPGRGPYCLSKAALITLTRLQAVEWAERGIRVNAIAPGYILNPTTQALANAGSLDLDAICRRTPLGRLGSEEDVAASICYLLDPLSAGYVTGHVLEVNGGWTAYGFI